MIHGHVLILPACEKIRGFLLSDSNGALRAAAAEVPESKRNISNRHFSIFQNKVFQRLCNCAKRRSSDSLFRTRTKETLICQDFPQNGKAEWHPCPTGRWWGQAGCHSPQPHRPSSGSPRQRLRMAACCRELGQPETGRWGRGQHLLLREKGPVMALNGCLVPPLQPFCLSRGEKHPVMTATSSRRGSGGRGWGHRRCRGGVRPAGGPRGDGPEAPWVHRGRCRCISGCRSQGQPRGWGCVARRGRGSGSTPPPRLFFSHRGRHTPLPAPAAPALPAPAAEIRRAAGGAEPSLGGHGTLGVARRAGGAMPGAHPPTMLPAEGHRGAVGAGPSARRPAVGAAAVGPSLPTQRGAAGPSLSRRSGGSGSWRSPLPASCLVLCTFKDTRSSLINLPPPSQAILSS